MCRLSAGSSYYDNVRPLAYPDSDAVLICFDISRPETLDSVIKKVRIHVYVSVPQNVSEIVVQTDGLLKRLIQDGRHKQQSLRTQK